MVRRSIPPVPYRSPVAIPPGETIKDIIEARDMSQKELATRMGRPPQEVSYLINGKRTITPVTAKQLEYVLGIKASFWLNIERDYQETKARLESEALLSEQIEKAKHFPYSEMVKFGLVNADREPIKRVSNLLSFFQVADFDALYNHIDCVFGYYALRRSEKFKSSRYRLAVWLRMGEIEASDLKLKKFNSKLMQKYLPTIRSLTLEKPEYFVPELKKIGCECGVAFLFIREVKGFPVSGLTRWIGTKPFIQLTLRYKTNDHLWFSLFHEIGHVLNYKSGGFYINMENSRIDDPFEEEANKFARNTLISESVYQQIIAYRFPSEKLIRDFAKRIGIAPGIIVGRLQHDKKIGQNQLNKLKIRYNWE